MPKDIWIGLVTLAVALLYWLEADKIPISPLDGPVGASGLPQTLAYALGALSVALIVRGLMGLRRPAPAAAEQGKADGLASAPEGAPGDAVDARREKLRPHLRAIGMLAIGVVYLLVVPVFGYALSIMALMMAVSLYIGVGVHARSISIAVLGGIFFHLLFVEFLNIPLPRGSLVTSILQSIG